MNKKHDTHTHTRRFRTRRDASTVQDSSRRAGRPPRAVVAPTHLATRSRARREDDDALRGARSDRRERATTRGAIDDGGARSGATRRGAATGRGLN